MKKTVLVDMDGVLADIYPHFIALEEKESGIRLDIKTLDGKLEAEAFPSFSKMVNDPDCFRTVPRIPGSVEGLKYLNDKYDVVIVSSATEFPTSLTAKHAWLNEFFPFIGWQQMIFCGSKIHVKGDVMIDDHPKNLSNFDGQRIIFSQPHNALIDDNSFTRVHSWAEIMDIL